MDAPFSVRIFCPAIWDYCRIELSIGNELSQEIAMINTSNQKPIRVLTAGTCGSYIMVPMDQLETVCELLRANDVPHWVGHYSISVNDRPAVVDVNLRLKVDPVRVQELLDAA